MSIRVPVKSGIYKYARLVANPSNYTKRMNTLGNRIFTEVVRPTPKTSMRVVNIFAKRPLDLTPEVVDYYPRHIEIHNLMMTLRSYGLYRDEHQDFKEEMIRLRALRGKVKPKRGERMNKKK